MDKKGVNNIKVSIITVSYNAVDTIEKTIQSVLLQTYQDVEYIIIDGLSTDGTQQIIEKYKDRIAYYSSEKDEGLYYAMNKGIQKATGEIIGIINSDDWYVENAVENVVDYFLQSEADLVYGKIINVSQEHEQRENWQIPLEYMWYEMAVPHPSVFVRKQIYEQWGVFNVEYKLAADYELLLRFYSEKMKFGYLDKVIAYFQSGGISETRRKESIDEVYRISLLYVDKSPDRCYIRQKIKERHEWTCFSLEIQNVKGLFSDLMCKYFHENIKEMNIFGTGIWGEQCYKILTENGINIKHIVDNDKSKQNMDFHGINIIAPQRLTNVNTYILIAVKKYGAEIKKQLETEISKRLKCVTIEELEMLYVNSKIGSIS